MKNVPVKPGIYRHFKGGIYRVIGIAKHSETLEDYVVYEALCENKSGQLWIRPQSKFTGLALYRGKQVSRFTPANDSSVTD
jgi:hypothetical protein